MFRVRECGADTLQKPPGNLLITKDIDFPSCTFPTKAWFQSLETARPGQTVAHVCSVETLLDALCPLTSPAFTRLFSMHATIRCRSVSALEQWSCESAS